LHEYILMTKMPGITLTDHYSWMSETEQTRVKAAFEVAVKAVHACSVDNGSPHLGNVIWDEQEGKW
jgi:hypothetical protein